VAYSEEEEEEEEEEDGEEEEEEEDEEEEEEEEAWGLPLGWRPPMPFTRGARFCMRSGVNGKPEVRRNSPRYLK
jgi:hypothetical protein